MMVDTHAHAHFRAYKDDMDEVIRRSQKRGVIMNLVGTQRDTSQKGVEVAEQYDGCYASVGLHPEHLFSKYVDEAESSFHSREEDFDFAHYQKLAKHPKTIAIGECGLDLYRIPEGLTVEKMLPKQQDVFQKHIDLALAHNLPMVIHCREAHDHLIKMLQKNTKASKGKLKGTIHCYTSNWSNAEQYLAMGFYIGFTGVVTFPPQKKNPQAQEDLLEVVRRMPEDKILLETDCPYLSPIPYRGQRGEPWMVEATAAKIAELRKTTLEYILSITTKNARTIFTKMKA
jgi:TatD DNase family protein